MIDGRGTHYDLLRCRCQSILLLEAHVGWSLDGSESIQVVERI